jgi:hypothetical protein
VVAVSVRLRLPTNALNLGTICPSPPLSVFELLTHSPSSSQALRIVRFTPIVKSARSRPTGRRRRSSRLIIPEGEGVRVMSARCINARRGTSPSRKREVVITALLMLSLAGARAAAQQPDIAPELLARMAKEKEARRACKVETCTAFAKPATGTPITCDVTQTITQQDIFARIMAGSYVWGYGHVQCNVRVSLDRGLIIKAMTEAKGTITLPEHTFICDVDDKDYAKGKAFSVKVMVTPVVTFEERKAKSAALEAVKTEGSTLASAVVASLMAFDKASGVLSRTVVAEINKFLFERCKDEGVEIPR